MPSFDTGKVVRILSAREGVSRVLVEIGGEERRATVFTGVTGDVAPGDRVVVNTTGLDLGLGTGGEDFVVWNLERSASGSESGGHILKLRYTPWQIDVMIAEAPESRHHKKLRNASSIEGMCVVACGLHSQIAPVAAVVKDARPDLTLSYVMTDGAALPIVHSDLVNELKGKDLIQGTVTCGHAFGGDLESVNVFSGLLAAHRVLEADVTIVAVGPGIVGTDTPLGHTGMEQGQVVSAVAGLGGKPVAALRISFADTRERHRVVSHHSLSALTIATTQRCVVPVPKLDENRTAEVMKKLDEAGITAQHEVRLVDATRTHDALERFDLKVNSMGRSFDDDPSFFEAAGAAGVVALQIAQEA